MPQSLHGIVNALKPPGMTSHDVVKFVRGLCGSKVGHMGALDPLAAGVLPLGVGRGTRLSKYVMAVDRAYRAEFLLGIETETMDLEGQVTRSVECADVTGQAVEHHMEGLTGELQMVPPMFSAVKHQGRKLYELAREGKRVEPRSRTVQIKRFDLLSFEAGRHPKVLCEIECSKGTYIRSLASMLGERVGCGACVSFLLRTRHGAYRLEQAHTLEELLAASEGERWNSVVTPLSKSLPDHPHVMVEQSEADRLRDGMRIAREGLPEPGAVVMVVNKGEAVCLAEVVDDAEGSWLQPRTVFPSD